MRQEKRQRLQRKKMVLLKSAWLLCRHQAVCFIFTFTPWVSGSVVLHQQRIEIIHLPLLPLSSVGAILNLWHQLLDEICRHETTPSHQFWHWWPCTELAGKLCKMHFWTLNFNSKGKKEERGYQNILKERHSNWRKSLIIWIEYGQITQRYLIQTGNEMRCWSNCSSEETEVLGR